MNFYEKVYEVVKTIPKGKVLTYSDIAKILNNPKASRAVGYALNNLKDNSIPWHRVVNKKGEISIKQKAIQRELLEKEGIEFVDDKIDFNKYLYRG